VYMYVCVCVYIYIYIYIYIKDTVVVHNCAFVGCNKTIKDAWCMH